MTEDRSQINGLFVLKIEEQREKTEKEGLYGHFNEYWRRHKYVERFTHGYFVRVHYKKERKKLVIFVLLHSNNQTLNYASPLAQERNTATDDVRFDNIKLSRTIVFTLRIDILSTIKSLKPKK